MYAEQLSLFPEESGGFLLDPELDPNDPDDQILADWLKWVESGFSEFSEDVLE